MQQLQESSSAHWTIYLGLQPQATMGVAQLSTIESWKRCIFVIPEPTSHRESCYEGYRML